MQSSHTNERSEPSNETRLNPKDLAGRSKPDITLISPTANLAEAGVMKLGATKYGAFNWRDRPIGMRTYLAAIHRHLAAVQQGEDVDSESGLPHIAHIRANTGILLDAAEQGTLVDDRPSNTKHYGLLTYIKEMWGKMEFESPCPTYKGVPIVMSPPVTDRDLGDESHEGHISAGVMPSKRSHAGSAGLQFPGI
jgi:Domain of unknown function (DUF5664)